MAKVRAYELAHELNIDIKALLALLRQMGEFVRSGSSTIEAPVERRLKERLTAMPDEERQQLPRPSTKPRPRELPKHLQTADPSVPKDRTEPEDWDWQPPNRPPGQSRPGPNPFESQPVRGQSPANLDALMAQQLESDRPGQQSRPGAKGSPPWRPTRRPSSRTGRLPKIPPKPAPDRWAEAWFTPDQQDEWTGAGVYEPTVAQACIDKGLRPEDLSERVAGRRIAERLASGEKLTVILALQEEERRFREGS